MTKTITLRNMLLALMLAAGFQVSFAQTPFWTESFSDEIQSLTTWENGGINTGSIIWSWTTDPAAGNWSPGNFSAPTAATGYMWFDSDANGEGFPHDATITNITAPVNCSGKSNVHLKFYTYYRTFTGSDVANIGISTDGTNFTYHSVSEFDELVAETSG
ncbi:MAG: hypothetical protein ACKOCO_10355, partial [Bacteroidota bacterium]